MRRLGSCVVGTRCPVLAPVLVCDDSGIASTAEDEHVVPCAEGRSQIGDVRLRTTRPIIGGEAVRDQSDAN